jgi:hypothetical protein
MVGMNESLMQNQTMQVCCDLMARWLRVKDLPTFFPWFVWCTGICKEGIGCVEEAAGEGARPEATSSNS